MVEALSSSGTEEVSECVPGESLSDVDTKVLEATDSLHWGSVDLEWGVSVVPPLSPEVNDHLLGCVNLQVEAIFLSSFHQVVHLPLPLCCCRTSQWSWWYVWPRSLRCRGTTEGDSVHIPWGP